MNNSTIGGLTAAKRNVIGGNGGLGISIADVNTVNVLGNYVGVDATGNAPLGSLDGGVSLVGGAIGGTNNTIGGTTAGARNIISANTNFGVRIAGAGYTNNTVFGNYIGTNAAGTTAIGNNVGVQIDSGAKNNTIGTTQYGQSVLTSETYRYLIGVAVTPTRAIFAIDYPDPVLGGPDGRIFQIDPVTGNRTLFAQGGFLRYPNSFAVEASGNLVVTNLEPVSFKSRLIRINSTTGVQTLLTDPSNAGQGPTFDLSSVAVEASGHFVLASFDDNAIWRINRTTGNRTLVSSGGLLNNPAGIAVGLDGTIYVSNFTDGKIIKVNPTTGIQSTFVIGLSKPVSLLTTPNGSLLVSQFVRPMAQPTTVRFLGSTRRREPSPRLRRRV